MTDPGRCRLPPRHGQAIDPSRWSVPPVVRPVHPVETSRCACSSWRTGAPTRTGTGPGGRASRRTPPRCRSRDRLASHALRWGYPRRRLLIGSRRRPGVVVDVPGHDRASCSTCGSPCTSLRVVQQRRCRTWLRRETAPERTSRRIHLTDPGPPRGPPTTSPTPVRRPAGQTRNRAAVAPGPRRHSGAVVGALTRVRCR